MIVTSCFLSRSISPPTLLPPPSHPCTCLNEVHCLKDSHVLDLLPNYLTIEVAWRLGGVALEEKETIESFHSQEFKTGLKTPQ